MATTLTDIHPDIIQTHILPRLDGRSLSTTTTVSSYLQSLCSDDNLWADISNSTWPSITHPRVHDVISTFPAGHRSFFEDSFPALVTDVNHRRFSWSSSKQPDRSSCSSQPLINAIKSFISAVDIRYQNDVVYSTVQFTHTDTDFLSSAVRIELTNDPISNRSIDLKVDELAGADEATLSHLKESLTLSWILIDPTRKRACNLSSVKPVSARQDWMSNETVLQYVTVLPGSDPNEMVQCKLQVVLGVGSGLHVKHVRLKVQDVNCRCLNGTEFLVVTRGAILEENNVRRKVMDDDRERWRGHLEFKEMKREKKEWERKEEEKRENAVKMNYIFILVSFCFSIYFLMLLLK